MRNFRTILRSTIFVILILFLAIHSLHGQETKENSEFKLAVNLYNDGMYDLALDQLTNFIRAYPNTQNSIEAQYYLGLTQMKLKKYDDARVSFQNFALTNTSSPKTPEAWMRTGDAYAALKNDREAASAYERVKIFYPNSPLAAEGLLKAATFYHRADAKENARKALRTILQDYASTNSIHAARLALGEIDLGEGRTSRAETEFLRVKESATDPELKARAHLLLGKLYLSAGRTADAEKMFTAVTSLKSSSSLPEAALELGKLYRFSGKMTDAIEQFKKSYADSTADDSLRSAALVELGDSYAALLDFANALRYYEKFLTSFQSGDSTPTVYLKAGKAAARFGKYDLARSYFDKVLSADGNDFTKRRALVAMAEAAVKEKDFGRAASSYSTYVQLYPADYWSPTILFGLGSLYENDLRDYRRAIDEYEKIVQFYLHSLNAGDAMMAIASCREKLSLFDAAVAAYGELIERFPSSKHVVQAEEKMNFLKNHRVRNRDEGLDRMALLLGEMLTEKDRAGLSFKLGQIYFEALKDYAAAARQFTAAINGALSEEQFRDAYFYRARCYHILSDIKHDAATDAITYFGAFLKQFPSGTWSNDAGFYLFQLRCKGKPDGEIGSLAKEYLAARPTSPFRDRVLLALAESQKNIQLPREALVSLKQITTGIPNSSLAQQAWIEIGKIQLELGAPDSAMQAWKTTAALNPQNRFSAEALWQMALLSIQQNKPQDAITHYRKLLSDHANSKYAEKAGAGLGDAYLAAGNLEDAVELFRTSWEREISSPFASDPDISSLFKLASSHQRKGNLQKAMELFRAYLNYDRTSKRASDAYVALGEIARKQGDDESASSYFRQAAFITSGGKATREIADLLFQTGQYSEAVKQYTSLFKSAESDADRQYFQARVIVATLRQNNLKGSLPLIEDYAKTFQQADQFLAEIEYERALATFRAEDYVNAKKSFTTVIDDYDRTRFAPWAEFYLAKILELTNKQQEATRTFELLLKKYPRHEITQRIALSLGNASYASEKYQDAVTYFRQIVDAPDSAGEILPYAMNNLIGTYEALQLYDAALKTTRDFIERFPNDESILDKKINVGVLYTRLGYYDQAALQLRNLLDEAGSDLEAEIRYNLGEAYFYKGDYQQAILEFLKVPYLVTKKGKLDWTATSLYMAGQSYEKMSKFDQAIAMYQQIIDRPGIDSTFKAGAGKEIDRVKSIVKGSK